MDGQRYIAHLNSQQMQAALCRVHCLVVAAPGSGKTGMLAAKAAYLLADGKSTVAAVTFTRDSALELRHRIVVTAGTSVLPRLLVGTFHSINLLMSFPNKKSGMGGSILSQVRSPFKTPWKIASNGERQRHLLCSLQESGLHGDLDLINASKVIETFKSSGKLPSDPRYSGLVELYQKHMAENKVIDFQDILVKTNNALKSGHLTPLPVNFLLIDEYQDTDQVQFEWAMAHAKGSAITCVGDDDQSIYGFRNALGHEGMEKFIKQTSAQKIILGVNYRSHSEILEPAGKVIAKNIGRVDKVLFANKGNGGQSYWDFFANVEAEGDAASLFAASALKNGETVAVLTRTNRRLDAIEARLVVRQIPYRRAEGDSLMDSLEFSVFMALAKCVVKPGIKEINFFLGWANVSSEDLTNMQAVAKGDLRCTAIKKDKNLVASDHGKKVWATFAKSIFEWQDLSGKCLHNMLIESMTSYVVSLTEERRSKHMFNIVKNLFMPQKGSNLESRIATLVQASKAVKEKQEHAGNECLLTTAHGSKGLEFDKVWIAGAVEDVFPDSDGGIEEERRLFYVAMTRAKKQLVISAANSSKDVAVSRFVSESKIERAPQGMFGSLS
jgi:superfamily I DNA/RNA helicase